MNVAKAGTMIGVNLGRDSYATQMEECHVSAGSASNSMFQ